ncbi:transglycosylase family protein [Streptomyces sp. NPDC053431]|uniref:LysM peptidoglycan-binding domain-containing protein n=1 Tax=Streptomyces sp. NPDC053431 TaxID=3365703 RepID=UPI0037D5C304
MSKIRSWTAGAVVLAAALLPQGLAAAAAAAPGAPAAPTPVEACVKDQWPWGCVAACESGGDWRADTGNGFYGGLQFWPATWDEFGGRRYARRADLATRAQQIKVAENVLRVQGWSAWPACSRRYGLSGRAHVVQPGDTLSAIARRFKIRGGWQALYATNRSTIGPDPNRLTTGTMLRLSPL